MEEEELLGISDYIAILRRRKFQLIIPAVIILLISIVIAVGLPSIYRAEATILIEQQEIPNELVRSTVTSFAGERIQVISQRVMTTENLGKIIKKYGLYRNKIKNTSISLLAEELSNEVELEMISADVIDPRSGRPTTATIAFTLSFSNKDPRVAQKVTNEFVSLFLDENLKQRTKSALETSSFLTAEADRLSSEITELEASLAEFKEKHVNNLPELQQLNIQLMERNERELTETKLQIKNLEERQIYLRSELAQINPSTDLYNSNGNRVMGTEDRLRALQTDYLALETRYTKNHPSMIKVMEEINALKKELSIEAKNKKNVSQSENPAYLQLETQLQAAETELQSLESIRDELKSKVAEYEERLIQSPQVEREYRNLTRDYENALSKYQEVKAKQLEAQLAESLERERKGERFSLIEPPQFPEKPDKPNRIVIVFLGLVLGIFGGIGNVAVRESVDDTVTSKSSIETVSKLKTLAIIPYIKTSEDMSKNVLKKNFALTLISVVFIIALVTLHFVYMPLDVLMAVVMRKIGLDS
jgi:polysaccharide chain length determinant protein (PEP-CTERM system associated)